MDWVESMYGEKGRGQPKASMFYRKVTEKLRSKIL